MLPVCRLIKQLEIKHRNIVERISSFPFIVSTIKDRETRIKINYYAVVVGSNHDEQ